jgi:hypothetical protein
MWDGYAASRDGYAASRDGYAASRDGYAASRDGYAASGTARGLASAQERLARIGESPDIGRQFVGIDTRHLKWAGD